MMMLGAPSNLQRSASTSCASFSIATTWLQRDARRSVIIPLPGPISYKISLDSKLHLSSSASTRQELVRKFCAYRMLLWKIAGMKKTFQDTWQKAQKSRIARWPMRRIAEPELERTVRQAVHTAHEKIVEHDVPKQ